MKFSDISDIKELVNELKSVSLIESTPPLNEAKSFYDVKATIKELIDQHETTLKSSKSMIYDSREINSCFNSINKLAYDNIFDKSNHTTVEKMNNFIHKRKQIQAQLDFYYNFINQQYKYQQESSSYKQNLNILSDAINITTYTRNIMLYIARLGQELIDINKTINRLDNMRSPVPMLSIEDFDDYDEYTGINRYGGGNAEESYYNQLISNKGNNNKYDGHNYDNTGQQMRNDSYTTHTQQQYNPLEVSLKMRRARNTTWNSFANKLTDRAIPTSSSSAPSTNNNSATLTTPLKQPTQTNVTFTPTPTVRSLVLSPGQLAVPTPEKLASWRHIERCVVVCPDLPQTPQEKEQFLYPSRPPWEAYNTTSFDSILSTPAPPLTVIPTTETPTPISSPARPTTSPRPAYTSPKRSNLSADLEASQEPEATTGPATPSPTRGLARSGALRKTGSTLFALSSLQEELTTSDDAASTTSSSAITPAPLSLPLSSPLRDRSISLGTASTIPAIAPTADETPAPSASVQDEVYAILLAFYQQEPNLPTRKTPAETRKLVQPVHTVEDAVKLLKRLVDKYNHSFSKYLTEKFKVAIAGKAPSSAVTTPRQSTVSLSPISSAPVPTPPVPAMSLFGGGVGERKQSFSLPSTQPSPPVLVADIEKRISEIYAQHNPQKLHEVPTLMAKYKGSEADLLHRIETKYKVAAALPSPAGAAGLTIATGNVSSSIFSSPTTPSPSASSLFGGGFSGRPPMGQTPFSGAAATPAPSGGGFMSAAPILSSAPSMGMGTVTPVRSSIFGGGAGSSTAATGGLFGQSSGSRPSSMFGGTPSPIAPTPFSQPRMGSPTSFGQASSAGTGIMMSPFGSSTSMVSPIQSPGGAPTSLFGAGGGGGGMQTSLSLFQSPAPVSSGFTMQSQQLQQQSQGMFQGASAGIQHTPPSQMLSIHEISLKLRNLYSKYDASKLDSIPHLLDKYRGKEMQLLLSVEKKYLPPQGGSPATATAATTMYNAQPQSVFGGFGQQQQQQSPAPGWGQPSTPTAAFGGGSSSLFGSSTPAYNSSSMGMGGLLAATPPATSTWGSGSTGGLFGGSGQGQRTSTW